MIFSRRKLAIFGFMTKKPSAVSIADAISVIVTSVFDWKSVSFLVKIPWKSVLFMVKMHWKSVIFLVFLVGPRAIVLCQDNVQVNDNVTYMPIYMLMFMQHEQTEDVIYKFQPI